MIEYYYYYKKSIYQRRYHYHKKVNEANKKFNLGLSGEEKYELYLKLMKMDEKVLHKINEEYKRKRLINIFYN